MAHHDHPVLYKAGEYRRNVAASLERVWENVFDWEHLGHLHDSTFATCTLVDKGDWGWRADIALIGASDKAMQTVELRADIASGHYVTTTLEGQGTGTQIRVWLTERAAHETGVLVEFHVPEADAAMRAFIGKAYEAGYARLWDEDEAMMQAREAMLALKADQASVAAAPQPLEMILGDEQTVRGQLPLAFEMHGRPFHLVAIDGALHAYSAICPHWLGPLNPSLVSDDGMVRCPWHGYHFDVVSRACHEHKALKLAKPPTIFNDNGIVLARWP